MALAGDVQGVRADADGVAGVAPGGHGGAPVWLSVPPWHMTQFTFQLAMPAGRPTSWHWAQDVAHGAAGEVLRRGSPGRRGGRRWRRARGTLGWRVSIQAAAWRDERTVPSSVAAR